MSEKKITPVGLSVALFFILAVQLLSIYVTYLNRPAYVYYGYSYAPAGSTSSGSVINVISLVLLVFLATLLLSWLLRRRRISFFKIIIFASIALTSFPLTLLTADSIISSLGIYTSNAIYLDIFLASIPVVVSWFVIFVKNVSIISTAVFGFISSEVGSFFASTLPPLTAVLLPAAFAVYDIYAVFKGPLKHMLSATPGEALVGAAVRVGDFTIGLGDVIFYSMLPSIAVYYSGMSAALFTLAAIELGVVTTFALLKKRRVLPGLPIPMLLGLIVLLPFVFQSL